MAKNRGIGEYTRRYVFERLKERVGRENTPGMNKDFRASIIAHIVEELQISPCAASTQLQNTLKLAEEIGVPGIEGLMRPKEQRANLGRKKKQYVFTPTLLITYDNRQYQQPRHN